jgi:hypothetical protein
MPVSAVNSAPAAPAPANAPVVSSTARAADGDYRAKSSKTVGVKDADGDYKPVPTQAASPPAAASSTSTQAALTNIKLGG